MNTKRIGLIAFAIVTLAGCQGPEKQPAGLLVEIRNGTEFPKELAGTWICEENKWQIILEEDGTVSWILYPMGYVWMEPWETTTVPMKMGKTSTYAAAEVKAVYDPKTTVFSIDIVIPFFEIAMGDDTLTGDSTDIFTGPMDGENGLWVAEWLSMATYIVNTNELKEHALDTDDEVNRGKVVFRRYHIVYEDY